MSDKIIQLVCDSYQSKGWTVIKLPKGGINDIIAANKTKVHFVQVLTKKSVNFQKYNGLAKNTFIQNAFSNNAIPVHAIVYPDTSEILFQDVNLGSSVVITTVKKPVLK